MLLADLNQMVVFESVVREGSFTAAARTLGQPKSTVSKRVAELEARLGARLLHRSTRRITPTEEGAAYYERCRRIVHDAVTADRAVMDHDGAPRGLVRVTGPVGMAGLLGPVAMQFLRAYPEVSLELALVDRKVDLVQEGFDLAIRAGALRDSSLVTRRLGVAERILVASPRYLDVHGAPRRPDDLREHQCIVSRTEASAVGWVFERRGRRVAVPVTGRFSVTTAQLARDAALGQFGIANLPRFTVRADLAASRLVEVLPSWPLKLGEIHLLYPSAQYLSPRVRALIDMLVAAFTARP